MSVVGIPRGFDFHCHVDLDRDPASLIVRCQEERIVTLAVTTTPRAWPQNFAWARGSGYVLPALGLHPELIATHNQEIALLNDAISETRFIGEVGLDGSRQHRQSLPLQQDIFGEILSAAQHLGGRVMTIHSRWAAREVIELIAKRTTKQRVLCILHWFSGSPSVAKDAGDLGCYFSVNAAMLANERGRALVMSLPTNRLLTETDSPFTTTGTRASVPWDVVPLTSKLAQTLGLPLKQTIHVLAENARKVLAFAGVQIKS